MTIRWGLLAAGNISRAFLHGVSQTESGEISAVACREQSKADDYAKENNIEKAYGSYQALLDDPDIDAVYISTPHPMHAEWAIKAANAGKHILSEKPATMSHADLMTVIEAARSNDVYFMEAYMYRCTPQTAKIVELISSGAIGEVRIIDAVFSFQAGFHPDGRLFNAELGGGGILDVGGYAVSMARLVAGVALGKDYADPIKVSGDGHVGESGIDEWACATLTFENDIIARVSTGVSVGQDSIVKIYGSEGKIVVESPWFCHGSDAGESTIEVHKGGDVETITCSSDKGIYALEADVLANNIANRQAPSPAMSWGDSLGNASTLDQWIAAVGVDYPSNRQSAYTTTRSKEPLKVSDDAPMIYGELPGVNKKISRLVMGMDNQMTISHATAMFDDFFARGGNTFDTAFIYAGGLQERLFGQWVENRGNREDVILIDKGAHTPYCLPECIGEQLKISLERLGFDYTDIYFMHRDNLDVPIGEFVDALNDLKDQGLMNAFGGSNWSLPRIKEFNEYAAANGKTGFAAVSNNFSLAQMVDPVWGGCIASSTAEFRAFHEESQVALFPWSSQARGFFVPERSAPDKLDDEELARCWYSDENFQRQARCFELAKKYDTHPVCINLAYVLHQKFPIFPLIGPRLISETASTMNGLAVSLTDDEVKYLNLED